MKPFQANLLNAVILLVMGLWAFISSESRSMTILIPVFFGLVFLLCTPALKKENKVAAHIVAGLTLLLILALMMPLMRSLGTGDTEAIFRVGLMVAGSVFALVVFVRSFISNRRSRSVPSD